MNLQNKVLRGYIFLIVLISFMVSIVVHERQRISEISFQNDELQDIRRYINIAPQSITTLSILGESVIGWDDADYRCYHIQRLRTDSLLQALKPHCRDYVRPAKIDTLRTKGVRWEAICAGRTEARQWRFDGCSRLAVRKRW